MADRTHIVGLVGDSVDGLTVAAREAIETSALVIGAERHLEAVQPFPGRPLVLWGDIPAIGDAIDGEAGAVCVLASGDPGFFGIVRPLAQRFGPGALVVHPAPSSVSLAFARLGLPWDDATVVSAHGRPLAEAAAIAARSAKAAVLVSRDAPPEMLGAALAALGANHGWAAVCTRLGQPSEQVTIVDLPALAAGHWDPLSVVVLGAGRSPADVVSRAPRLAWGLAEVDYTHRDAMITKSEVRAVVLAKLELPMTPGGVVWDVGAGSGSVAVECARLAPWLDVWAVERDPEAVQVVRANAIDSGVAIHVIEGPAPAILASLPDPERAFVGGGGLEVLDAVRERVGSAGRIVASYASLDRAAAAAGRLGALAQVGISRGTILPDGTWRLVGTNPVFVAWGPGT